MRDKCNGPVVAALGKSFFVWIGIRLCSFFWPWRTLRSLVLLVQFITCRLSTKSEPAFLWAAFIMACLTSSFIVYVYCFLSVSLERKLCAFSCFSLHSSTQFSSHIHSPVELSCMVLWAIFTRIILVHGLWIAEWGSQIICPSTLKNLCIV